MKITITDVEQLKQELLWASSESFRPEIFRIFNEFFKNLEKRSQYIKAQLKADRK
jgi:hypothetical protein